MKIAVFIKEIPLSDKVKIDPKTNNLMRSNEQGRINPYDVHAIEAALKLKEKYGGEVNVISMGPPSFQMSLREALAMGCDNAYLLSSRAFAGADTLATAYTLAQAVKKLGDVDIMLFGLKAIDADTGQVGPLVAEALNVPQVTFVCGIDSVNQTNKTIDLAYKTETEEFLVRSSYPVVISVTEEINEPRYLSPLRIKHIMNQEITIWNESDLACQSDCIGMLGSPTIVTETYVPQEVARQVTMLEGSPQAAAEQLVKILKDKHVLKEETL